MSIVIISSKSNVSYFVMTFCMVVVTSCSTFSPIPPSITKPASPIEIGIPSFTATIVNTPALTITPSPYPTKVLTSTSTPPPEWVTSFAQPILDAIALRDPDFQDDFDDNSGGWMSTDVRAEWRINLQEGELVVQDGSARRGHMDYPDFVLELDGRFLKAAAAREGWAILFRQMDSSVHYGFGMSDPLGTVGIWGPGEGAAGDVYHQFPQAARYGYETNHLLMIAKGPQFAFYVNGQPLFYMKDTRCRWGDIQLGAWGTHYDQPRGPASIVAFDNFKLWDISEIYVP